MCPEGQRGSFHLAQGAGPESHQVNAVFVQCRQITKLILDDKAVIHTGCHTDRSGSTAEL